jgi:hypothetical protein
MLRLGVILLFSVLLLSSCKSRKEITKYKKTVEYGNNTLLKYTVNYGGSEYYLKIKIKSFGDSCSFIYSMTNAQRTEGSVDISAWAMNFATSQENYFNGGHRQLQNKTTVWLSRNSLKELKKNGSTILVPNYRDSVTLTSDTVLQMPMLVDGTLKNLPIIQASGTSKSGKKTYWILDDARFPLIIYMDLGWQVKLESIQHMPELNLRLKPTMLAFKPGLKLYYSLEEFGCGRDAVFEYLGQNDSFVSFKYEFYKYACLYGFNDEQYKGILEIPIAIWNNPKDFVLPIPTKNGTLRLTNGHPFFLDKNAFEKLFAKGSAVFNLSHFIYEPTEDDYEYMDSVDIAVAKEALEKAGTTRLLLKEADVETGYYMYPLEIDGAQKVTETVKLQATEIETKMLYVFPSLNFPIILSHYDEDLGFDWNLVGIEMPK